jgi:hypothetical protein
VDVGAERVQARDFHRRSGGRHHDGAPQIEHPARRRGTDGGVTAGGDDNTGAGEPALFLGMQDRVQTAADLERSSELEVFELEGDRDGSGRRRNLRLEHRRGPDQRTDPPTRGDDLVERGGSQVVG